jgi:hypothetical protein
MSTPKQKRNLLDFKQKSEIIDYATEHPKSTQQQIANYFSIFGGNTVKPRFIAPRFTAKLAYRQEFLQSRFPNVVITPLKCQTRIPPSATVIEHQTVNLLLFKPRS